MYILFHGSSGEILTNACHGFRDAELATGWSVVKLSDDGRDEARVFGEPYPPLLQNEFVANGAIRVVTGVVLNTLSIITESGVMEELLLEFLQKKTIGNG